MKFRVLNNRFTVNLRRDLKSGNTHWKPKSASDFGRILPVLDRNGNKIALDWLLELVIGTGTQIEKTH